MPNFPKVMQKSTTNISKENEQVAPIGIMEEGMPLGDVRAKTSESNFQPKET